MKRITAFVLAIVLSLSGFALSAGAFIGALPDYERGTFEAADHLTYYVLSKEETTYANSTDTTTYTYNNAGLCTKKVFKSTAGFASTTTYTYDKNNNITKWELKSDNGNYSECYALTYNKSGNAVKQTVTFTDDGVYTSVNTYAYNSKGLLTKQTSGDGDYANTTVYTYDGSGNLIKEVNDSNGEITTETFSYNADGTLAEATMDGPTNSYVAAFTYDSKGNLTLSDYVYSDGDTQKTTYTYNSKGLLTNKVIYYGEETSTTNYAYDSKGRLTKEDYESTATGYSYTDTHTYDSQGNETEYRNDACDYPSVTTYTYKKVSKPFVKAGHVTMEYASAVYNGSARKPAVSVEAAVQGADYRVIYSNCTDPGKATATIRFTNPMMGAIKVNYTVTPRQVTGLKAAAVKTDSIKVSWTKLTEAKAYKVEYSSNGKTWKSATVTANAYTLKNLKAGSKWQFRVTALDASKKIKGKTSAVLKTGTLTAAPKITKLTSSKAKTATVTWGKVTGASKYIVYKSTDGKKWTKATTTTKLTCTLTKLTGGKRIYVKIAAVNAYGKKSAASAVKYVTVKK